MNLPRMAVMQIRNVFRRRTKHAAQECTGRTFLGVPPVNFYTRLVSAPSIYADGYFRTATDDGGSTMN